MRIYRFLLLLFSTGCLFLSCQTKPKSGYVEIPTVTEHALSGVYNLSPKHPTTKIYYEELGSGEPLILLHDHALDCRMWDGVFAKLAKQFRVIRYDLRGYGHSDNPEVGFGYLHADDLKNLMDALHIQKAHVTGVSLGGMTLAEFVALYPERVLTATIASGALSGFPDRTFVKKELVKIYNDTIFKLKRLDVVKNQQKGMDSLKMEMKAAMKYASGKKYRKIRRDLFQMIDEWSGWHLMNPEVDAFIGAQADQLLKAQKKQPPVLFLIGQFDSKPSKKSMQRMGAMCKGSVIQIIPNSGRYIPMEFPKAFVKLLTEFARTHKISKEIK